MNQAKVGAFIAALRREKGLTQEQLGERLGVSNKTVSRWETAKYMPDVGMLLELSALLGVSVNELLMGERVGEAKEFVKKADENLVAALSESETFGWADRVAFYKSRWLRTHRWTIGFAAVLWLGVAAVLWRWARPWTPFGGMALGLALYGFLRNQMMIYVESRAFRQKEDRQTQKGEGPLE